MGEASLRLDDGSDLLRDGGLERSDPLGDLGVVGEIRGEHESVCKGVLGHHLEEGADGRGHAVAILRRRPNGIGDGGEQTGKLGVQEVQVELAFAGEVLIEHRLGDASRLGDVIHGRGVVTALGKNVVGHAEELGMPLSAWKSRLFAWLRWHGFWYSADVG